MIKLHEQVRVLRLTKMHDYLNVPPCIICTPCIIGLDTVPVESLDCELSENINFYVCQMSIIKSMLH